jgi:RecB family exonuclease
MLAAADQVLDRDCPWPLVRRLWRARIGRIARPFLDAEAARQEIAVPTLFEVWGEAAVPGTPVTVFGKADRIDLAPDGRVAIYDYKSGTPPTPKQQQQFDKQLLIEAAIAAQGGFADLGPVQILTAAYIALKDNVPTVTAPLDSQPPALIWAELAAFLGRWQDRSLGYAARRALTSMSDASDYDHLSRFGEWDITQPPRAQPVGP